MRESKNSLRAAALAQRGLLSKAESVSRSRSIQAQALQFPPYLMHRSVAVYSPIQNEVETAGIRDHALVTGKRVFYPRCAAENVLELIEIESVTELGMGRFGIPEPTGDSRPSPQDQEELVVFVPGVAFDVRGNRLGRGTGWYDRLIKNLGGATFIALAYDFQIVDEVPAEKWDQRVHYLITERRIIDCGSRPAQSSQAS
ncbi:MAG TPA: 5-formyltetrahydrofolate cyclo-ligase [Candidatus Binatia bacterium]|nr:5-formyltetrahydrofolate cyclo-ligase [Candidatus Binatia bacterium]